jgi:HSP20 family protein
MRNQLIRVQPLLSRLHALDRLFDSNLPQWDNELLGETELGQWIPKIDVTENANAILIRADVPGVNPKDIEVHLEDGLLTIKGQTEAEIKEEKQNYIRTERSSGSFVRSISLPDVGDASKIAAKSKNGVLEITIPKNKKSISHKIPVDES